MKRRRIVISFSIILFLLLIVTSIFAWYVLMDRKANVDDVEIEEPPIIYIRDDNMDEMKTFNLAGLERGTDYSFVFCVMPAKKGTAVQFQLAVAYTGNLGMDISLYPVSEVKTTEPSSHHICRTLTDKKTNNPADFYFMFDNTNNSWTDCAIKKADGKTDKEVNQNPNDGTRKTYTNITFGNSGTDNPSTYVEELNDTRNYRFFVMDITWEALSSNSIYEKEVDIIYIIASGKPIARS